MNKKFLTDKFKEHSVLITGFLTTIILIGVYFFRTGPASDLKNQYKDTSEEVELLLANERNGGELGINLENIKQYTALMNGLWSRLRKLGRLKS